jgi:hypothetical protein
MLLRRPLQNSAVLKFGATLYKPFTGLELPLRQSHNALYRYITNLNLNFEYIVYYFKFSLCSPHIRSVFYIISITSLNLYLSYNFHIIGAFLIFIYSILGSRDSAVGIVTGYGLDCRGVGVRVPVGSRILSSPRRPDQVWGPHNLRSNEYPGHVSLGVKRPGG